MPVFNTEPVLRAVATAIMPCVFVDLIVFVILRSLPSTSGKPVASAASVFGWLFTSLFANALTCGAFAFAYLGTWVGTGRAFLFGGLVWVIIAAPVLAMSRHMEDFQKKAIYIRIFSWLAKTAIVAASCTYFLG
jgi:hypothetical protein